MSSQLLPRNLCFLIAFFLGLGASFSAITSLEASTKLTDSKNVSNELIDNYYFKIPVLSPNVNATQKTATSINTTPATNSDEKALISQIEEISYNNKQNLAVGNSIILQETESSLSEGKTLFKQGMFYGFALMVVLLNLVCFLLFEEKIFLFYSLALTFVTTSFMHSDGVLHLLGMEPFKMQKQCNQLYYLLQRASVSYLHQNT